MSVVLNNCLPASTLQFMEATIVIAIDKLFTSKYGESIGCWNALVLLFPQIGNMKYPLRLGAEYFLQNILEKLKIMADKYTTSLGLNTITPWLVELCKDDVMIQFLGPIRFSLPGIVIIKEEQRLHEITEDLALGMIAVLTATENGEIFVQDELHPKLPISVLKSLTFKDIVSNYLVNDGKINKRYTATLYNSLITFDSMQVVEGVRTAAAWIDNDPHNFISNIKEGDVCLTF